MKTLKKVPVFPIYVSLMPDVMEDGNIYISKEYDVAIHRCLCGCKTEVVTPLVSSGWKLTDKEGKITMTPSIGNYHTPCKSHYIITNGIANIV